MYTEFILQPNEELLNVREDRGKERHVTAVRQEAEDADELPEPAIVTTDERPSAVTLDRIRREFACIRSPYTQINAFQPTSYGHIIAASTFIVRCLKVTVNIIEVYKASVDPQMVLGPEEPIADNLLIGHNAKRHCQVRISVGPQLPFPTASDYLCYVADIHEQVAKQQFCRCFLFRRPHTEELTSYLRFIESVVLAVLQ